MSSLEKPAGLSSLVGLGSKTERTTRALQVRFLELVEKVRQTRPASDIDLLRRAFEFAAEQHRTQLRKSGDPYLSHPLEVAHILADMKLDITTLSAALLHDVVEDTRVSAQRIGERFGPDIATLVEGVTKINRLDLLAPEARQAENVRKMLLAMVNDVRVVVVKLADRLHNMRTLGFLPPEKQQRIARETLEIYAPIAHRLGMGLIRGELEDIAFSYLEPEAYQQLQSTVIAKRKEFEAFLGELKDTIRKRLEESGISAVVDGRVKRLYSIHQKSLRQHRTADQIYDLLAVRVITDTIRNCYAALGVVHQVWRPVPGRFKDYIAMPRPNLYQSLHTTVIHAGQTFEVQIRTQEMHRIAEQGVAAHWRYKDGQEVSEADDQRILWMRQLIEWVKEMQEPSEFMSTLKVDLYPEEVYAFTPKGKVLALPRGATPVDFAYAVHTEVGNQCIGAKVNGQIVPLRHRLSNGDVVEVLAQKGHVPSRDWLNFVRTSRARGKIRHHINSIERSQATEVGRRLLEREARQVGRSLKKIPEAELTRVATEYGCAKLEDLFADLGYGKFSARQIIANALGEPLAPAKSGGAKEDISAGLVSTVRRMLGVGEAKLQVGGQSDLMVFRAKCCNPIPGDEIVGYVTRGRGVAVHSNACPNVQNLLYQVERRIDVEWSGATGSTYPVTLLIRAQDRPGMLADITTVISDTGSNIRTLGSHPDNLHARIDLTLEIADRKQLERITANIRKISGVFGVERLYNI